MHKKLKRLISAAIVTFGVVALALPTSAKIIEYNGTGSGGGGSGGGGELTDKSYSVPYTDMSKLFQGYRFSIYDGDGNKKYKLDEYGDPVNSLTIDVFVKTPFYRGTIMPCDSKGVVSVSAGQLSKKEWISGYSSSHVTPVPADKQTRVSYSNGSGKDSATGFDTDLPSTINIATLKEWFLNDTNRDQLYELCGLNSKVDSKNTDSIIVEPLFCAAVGGEGVTGTPTDFAMIGGNTETKDENGNIIVWWDKNGRNPYKDNTIAVIAEYTNYLFPNSLYTERDDLGISAGTPIATSDWYITFANLLNKGYGCNIVTLKDLLPSEYTDTIYHYMWGFKKQEDICTNDNKDAVLLDSTTFQQKVGSTFTLDTDSAIAPPNGFYCENDFGSSSIDGTWKDYAMGTSVTQKAAEMSFEYDYQPYTYNITYEMNGGNDDHNSPTTYNVLYPVSFYEPTREGYDFLGWYDENGNRVYGVNNTAENSDADFDNIDDLYNKLSKRTTGDITVYARWAEVTVSVKQNGYTKYNAEAIEGVPNGSTLTQELNSLIAGD